MCDFVDRLFDSCLQCQPRWMAWLKLLTYSSYGIFKEELIKVSQPKKEQGPRVPLLQLVILAQHWSGISNGHDLSED